MAQSTQESSLDKSDNLELDTFVKSDSVITTRTEQKIVTIDESRTGPCTIVQQPRMKLVIAQHSYLTQDSKKLSFKKGDVVRVFDDSGKWHLGVLYQTASSNGMVSKHLENSLPKHFPPNLFIPYIPDSDEQEVVNLSIGPVSKSASQSQNQTRVYAKAAFKATKEQQLSFTRGDVISVISSKGEWHRGILVESSTYPLTGKILFYPSNYVQAEPPAPAVGRSE